MKGRARYRLVAMVMLLAMLVPAWVSGIAQVATPGTPGTAGSGAGAIAEQRAQAVPPGEAGQVGDLEIVVTRFDQDASALLNPDLGLPPPPTRAIVNVELSLTNRGSEPVDAWALFFFTAGNRGHLSGSGSPNLCAVEGNVLLQETVMVAPGETATGNVCVDVVAGDVASLQLGAVERAAITGTVGQAIVESGAWFDLGAPEPFDPSIGEAAVEQALTGAVEGTLDAPASPTSTLLAGGLAFTLVEYQADATATFQAADMAAGGFADTQIAYVEIDVVNTGTEAVSPGVWLFDESALSASQAWLPDPLDLGMNSGLLLPGGTARVQRAWEAWPGTETTRVLRLGTASGVGWMLAAEGNAAAWDRVEVDLAAEATGDAASAVPYGATASVAGLNLTLAPGSAAEHTLEVAFVDVAPEGELFTIRVYPTEDDTCLFEFYYANGSTGSGSLQRIALPGAHQVYDLFCGDGGTGPLEVRIDHNGSEFIGYFARSGDVAAPAAEPAADPATEEAAAADDASDEAAVAPPPDGTSAVVIAATANVRAEPTTSAAIVTTVSMGDTLTITGDSVEADGYVWLPVTTADGTTGWIAGQLIERQ